MKILIIIVITLYLISGPVGHAVMVGYTGGRLVILSNLQWDLNDIKYICKIGPNHCHYIINPCSISRNIYTERFMLFRNSQGFLRVLMTNLKLQDSGMYRIGVGNQSSLEVNLEVRPNPSHEGPKLMTANQGQNISLTCNYPLEYMECNKFVYKEDTDNFVKDIRDIKAESWNSRFLISNKGSDADLSVNISDVREADEGVYLCGVMNRDQRVLYSSFYSEIQLHIKGDQFVTVIIVSGSVALLLFGGFALMIYNLLYKRTRGSACPPKRQLIDTNQAPSVYENVLANVHPYENTNVMMGSNHPTRNSVTSESDSTYQRLDPFTNQSDSGYASLTNITDQSHSHYQCLNPTTRSNSLYHTLQT